MSGLEPSYENIIKQELEVADLKRAIAEKDREIEKIRIEQEPRISLRQSIISITKECAEIRGAYHALMGQAVRFAEKLGKEIVTGGFSHIEYPEEVQDFLSSPEVRKWREQEGKK